MAAGIGPKHYLINNEDAVVYALRQGKPDTKTPLTTGEDQRPLVVQKGRKDLMTIFDAMNVLRKRIGPNPAPEHADARRTEKLISDFRKKVIAYEKQTERLNEDTLQSMVHVIKAFGLPVERTQMSKLLPQITDKIQQSVPIEARNENNAGYLVSQDVISLFQEFCQGNEKSVQSFLTSKQKSLQNPLASICFAFLQSLSIDPKNEYEKDIRNTISTHYREELAALPEDKREERIAFYFQKLPSWKDVLVGREEQVGKLYAVNYALKAFGFAEASWDLSKPITDLQETLKLHGPLIVGGAFGKFQYKNDPTSREKIADRTIYGWGAGDRKPIKEGPPYCQSIVIVGAKSGGPRGGYVYYVDPTEGSDPTDPNRQKIYVTTYENLISNIADFKGGGFGKEAVTPPFAYYYPNYGS